LVSGCASYRTSSNIPDQPVSSTLWNEVKIFATGVVPDKKFKDLQRIEISIKKLTAFHADPTKEQANAELKKRAAQMGADAVVNVRYQSGVGFMTWGYIDAQGMGVKFLD